jgi:hypothetical protein
MLLGFSAVVEAIRPSAAHVERQPPTAEELRRSRIIGGGAAALVIVLIAYSMWRPEITDTTSDYNSLNSLDMGGNYMTDMDPGGMNSMDMNIGMDMNMEGGNLMGSTP